MQIVMRTPFILLLNQAAEHSAQSTLEIYSLFLLGSYHSLGTILRKYYLFKVIIKYQRPWKTSVFPDEIKTKLMKMSKLKIFTFAKIMGKCSKLHFFTSKTSYKCGVISVTKCVSNYLKLIVLFGKVTV